MNDLIIIGGGPAALSAAAYALSKQLDFRIVFDDLGGKAGWHQHLVGQLADESLPGEETIKLLERKATASGRILRDRTTGVTKDGATFKITTEHHGTLESLAVIIATGATPVELPVPGAKEFLGQGLGYSIITHADLVAGKTVAVIGNTLRALRGAAEVAQTASQLYLIVPSTSILYVPLAQALSHRPNIEILGGARVKEITGAFNVEEIVVEYENKIRRIAVDAAFVDLGLYASSGPVRELLDLTPGQFIAIDDRNATAVSGLFAAGDVTTAFGEQILIAVGEGMKAALSAYEHILAAKARHSLAERTAP
ncbi:MAG TPA: NAD(P)/FAD-dependent oxidoreductase [Herpetosiphonaceae bacterium]